MQPPLFAARELGHRRVLLALDEQEALAHGRCCDQPVRRAYVLADALHHVDHGVGWRQLLVFLAKIPNHYSLSLLHCAFVGFDLAGQYFEQGGFSAAVGADDADAVVFQECIGEIAEQALVAIALAKAAHFDRLVAHPRWNRLDEDVALLDDLLPIPQRLKALDVGLLLGRAGPCAAHHPGQILLVELRHLALRRQREVHSCLLGLQVLLIIARIAVYIGPVDLPDGGRHFVQKVAVVGDHHQRAAIALQLVLQPLDHLVVQMVGRLVQDQQIAWRQQCCCQGCSLALPAGQGLRHHGRILDAQLFQHRCRFALDIPEFLILFYIADHILQDAPLGVKNRILRKIRDLEPVSPYDLPLVRFQCAGHDREQRRFAGAVDADHADAVIFVNSLRHVLQDRCVAEGYSDPLQSHQNHAMPPISSSNQWVLRVRMMITIRYRKSAAMLKIMSVTRTSAVRLTMPKPIM